ncbi:hypothetical protein BM523_17900 [Alteromonas mediterranea]|uniref:hypothetical protein n=1 Tax=Alteromonas mediterranea TaxID=314275 RepID=UPI0009036F41|nr:hypothetical protein [Alteromonas mediterranea]APD95717.1 hypothetical protein BM523_17900 [Alteromonas mediterranea]APD99351.1 hypothetical protein BM525_17925 [Alteromonas mediterranea]
MNGKLGLFLLSSLLIWSADAQSVELKEIKSIGCHLNDDTCYVTVSGTAVGPSQCNSKSLRWRKDASVSGKETLSLLTTAFVTQKKVHFNIVESCIGNYPTFNYFSVTQ